MGNNITIARFAFIFVAFLLLASRAPGADDTGQISGKVVDQEGAPVAGAYVMVIREGNETPFSKTVVAAPDGAFVAAQLPAGSFRLCAEKRNAELLNPCEWFDKQRTVAVADGEKINGASVRTIKGLTFTLRIKDSNGQLKAAEGATPNSRLSVVAITAGNRVHSPVILSMDKERTASFLLPYDTDVDLMILAPSFSLTDEKGQPVQGPGFRIPVKIAKRDTMAARQIEIAVAGLAQK